MPLPPLVPDFGRTTLVQQTTFAHDALGRYICNSWSSSRRRRWKNVPEPLVILAAGVVGIVLRRGASA
jgi:hypothetical protein